MTLNIICIIYETREKHSDATSCHESEKFQDIKLRMYTATDSPDSLRYTFSVVCHCLNKFNLVVLTFATKNWN